MHPAVKNKRGRKGLTPRRLPFGFLGAEWPPSPRRQRGSAPARFGPHTPADHPGQPGNQTGESRLQGSLPGPSPASRHAPEPGPESPPAQSTSPPRHEPPSDGGIGIPEPRQRPQGLRWAKPGTRRGLHPGAPASARKPARRRVSDGPGPTRWASPPGPRRAPTIACPHLPGSWATPGRRLAAAPALGGPATPNRQRRGYPGTERLPVAGAEPGAGAG